MLSVSLSNTHTLVFSLSLSVVDFFFFFFFVFYYYVRLIGEFDWCACIWLSPEIDAPNSFYSFLHIYRTDWASENRIEEDEDESEGKNIKKIKMKKKKNNICKSYECNKHSFSILYCTISEYDIEYDIGAKARILRNINQRRRRRKRMKRKYPKFFILFYFFLIHFRMNLFNGWFNVIFLNIEYLIISKRSPVTQNSYSECFWIHHFSHLILPWKLSKSERKTQRIFGMTFDDWR